MPFSPTVPVLSALAGLYPMLNPSIETWVRFVVWPALGLALYGVHGYRHSRLRSRREAVGTSSG